MYELWSGFWGLPLVCIWTSLGFVNVAVALDSLMGCWLYLFLRGHMMKIQFLELGQIPLNSRVKVNRVNFYRVVIANSLYCAQSLDCISMFHGTRLLKKDFQWLNVWAPGGQLPRIIYCFLYWWLIRQHPLISQRDSHTHQHWKWNSVVSDISHVCFVSTISEDGFQRRAFKGDEEISFHLFFLDLPGEIL